jgi:hypothetical protein
VIWGLFFHQFLPRITDRISDRSDTAEHLEPRLQITAFSGVEVRPARHGDFGVLTRTTSTPKAVTPL